jgi:hypothetical protein
MEPRILMREGWVETVWYDPLYDRIWIFSGILYFTDVWTDMHYEWWTLDYKPSRFRKLGTL